MTKDNTFAREITSTLSTPDGPVLVNIPIVPVMDSIVTDDGGIGMVSCALKSPDGDNDLDVVNNHEEEETDSFSQITVSADGQLIRTNQSALQSLLSAGSMSQIVNQQGGIQVVTLPTTQDLVGISPDTIQLVPTKYFGLVAIPHSMQQGKLEGVQMVQSIDESELNSVGSSNMATTTILMPQTSTSSEPPPGCPAWAAGLLKCEKIGDSYRGYVEDEVNLDIVLTLHKQQTNSFWGTRQSPSTAKSSTRLMWKSQYVPFDGIPFINSGSRAVVMECQYGPRRKGAGKKSHCPSDSNGGFRQTCPARIYVKKVRKFPTYAVNLNMDKKSIRISMDKAFHELREKGAAVWGEDRFYVQLPTEEAHDYHEGVSTSGPPVAKPEPVLSPQEELVMSAEADSNKSQAARINPRVLEKIRSLVASGETKLYAIRKQLRKFVVRELYRGSRQAPERHDLTVFPTVNDLKNHIHQALTDIQNGNLAQQATTMEMQISCSDPEDKEELEREIKCESGSDMSSLWSGTAMPETVTVTLTQNPDEDGHHIISRIETHLSDGTTQVSTSLTPETAQLLARLQPGLFRTGSLQLAASQLPSSTTLMTDGGESTPDMSQPVQVIPDLEMTPLVEGAHGMTFDTAQLTHIVDMDGTVHMRMIEDAETSAGVASIIKQEASPHSISGIHLAQQSSNSISGLVDSDSANLASIVTSDQCHLTALAPNHISILNSVDSVAAISDMVSPGATHLSIIPGASNSVDSIALVSADGAHHVPISLSGEEPHFEEGEHCVPGMTKTSLSCDGEGSESTLENDKITLHMTTDQELGMARLENKVSIL